MIFASLVESIRLEARTKAQQYQGLQRQTRHLANPYDSDSGHVEKMPARERTPRKAEREQGQELADLVKRGVARSWSGTKYRASRKDREGGGKAVKALRKIRDTPSRTKERKAQAALRLPIKFPKDRQG